MNSAQVVQKAFENELAIPAFNIPYLPMVRPVIEAVATLDSVAFIAVARLEWKKFEAVSMEAIHREFHQWVQPDHVLLHLDHVPVIDEDLALVPYFEEISEAVRLGYDSVMVDGSRLPLSENIEAVSRITEMAHATGVPCEAELGAVMGHEEGPVPPYEELFESGEGFTDIEQARRFVGETGCDWLSVAIGNVHGAISRARKDEKKVTARLHLGHLEKLREALEIPLVLHGGSGIPTHYIQEAIRLGMAKINVATDIRQPYEVTLRETGSVEAAQRAVYESTIVVIRDNLQLEGTRMILAGEPE